MAKSAAATKEPEFEAPVSDSNLGHLAALVAATKASGFMLLPEIVGMAFITPKFAEGKTEEDGSYSKDANGNMTVRATAEGIAYSEAHPATPSSDFEAGGAAAEPAATGNRNSGFVRPGNIEVDTGLAMPAARRGRSADGETAYPFDTMDKGTSFHIPATAACPEPAKSVASSVSAANDKYSDADPEFTEGMSEDNPHARKTRYKDGEGKNAPWVTKIVAARIYKKHFFTQSVDKSDPRGPGVRVWRDK